MSIQSKPVFKNMPQNFVVTKLKNFIDRLSHSRLRGFDLYRNSPDRNVLEDVIIPHIKSRH
ncbi:MAG: hypothetical protein VKL59_22620, partial [Nostocaceae cyanobacterium]|nr:hypothetical protein [Nostocaceae cyanobacterium]